MNDNKTKERIIPKIKVSIITVKEKTGEQSRFKSKNSLKEISNKSYCWFNIYNLTVKDSKRFGPINNEKARNLL